MTQSEPEDLFAGLEDFVEKQNQDPEEQEEIRRAWFCLLTGVQPSEADNMTYQQMAIWEKVFIEIQKARKGKAT